MKRLLLILLLIPSLAFGTYTEFYCQSGGSNLNAGSTTSNTALYTSTNGGWNSGTAVFTPTDGTNPVSAGVAVGMWASVYVDGASVGVYFARISAVTNAANGTITVGTTTVGATPSTNASARTIKVGGAWLGPNAASWFPFILTSFGNNKDSTGHEARVNFKNDQTYSMTASYGFGVLGSAFVMQGYTSSVNDGGRATIDGGTSTGAIVTDVGISGMQYTDLIFKTSITTGTSDLFTTVRISFFTRCVFTGARNNGIVITAGDTSLIECEAYDNNKANTAGKAGFVFTSRAVALRCNAHDNAGSNTSGFIVSTGPTTLQNCIADTNGKYGVSLTATSMQGTYQINNCDIYNNGSDGINIVTSAVNPVWIENCNFIKNGGSAINNVATANLGFIYNCGYGAGTQANTSADVINNLAQSGSVTYGSNLTPWVDPANGDFRTNLTAANFAGRAAFTETAASYTGAVGYPDIGSCQSLTGTGGTFSKAVSYGFTQ